MKHTAQQVLRSRRMADKANVRIKSADIRSEQIVSVKASWPMTAMTKNIKKQLKIFLPALLSVALFGAVVFWFILPQTRTIIMKNKLETIRELTHAAYSVLASYERQVQADVLNRTEAEAHAISRLRLMRYGPEGKDYFWINDLHPIMVMHPYRPELVDQDMSSFTDPKGKYLFREFVRIAEQRGEGFVRYHWQRENKPKRIEPKLSYVKLFEPWGWVLGTGIYLSDVQQEITKMRRKLILAGGTVLIAVLIVAGYVVLQGINFENERARMERELKQLASTDPLTGALNRRHFWRVADMEVQRHRRYFRELSVLIMDIDHFKRVNDTFGHPAGDKVLLGLVKSSMQNLRKSDLFGRIGGEEFAVLLVETHAEGAMEVADRLRRRLAEKQTMVNGKTPIQFTVSIGVTHVRREDETLNDMIKRADKALYQAKNNGRNRVEEEA